MLPRLLALILMLVPMAAVAQPLPKSIETYLDARGREGFSGTVLVARKGVVLKRAYGLADREWGVPNTIDTKFRIGSLTKQFTAAAILILADQGKLSLDDPLCRFVEDCPESWAAIRVRMLLNHSSGIPDLSRLPDFRERMIRPEPFAETLARLQALPLDFVAGTDARYGNSGPMIAAWLIEKLSGRSYADFLDAAIHHRLGLADTGFDAGSRILLKRARGYARLDGGFANAGYVDMTATTGAGSQLSTVEDLYRWDRALAGTAFLPAEAKRAMFAPGKRGFGLGWLIGEERGRRVIEHGGDINGFAAHIARYPQDDAVIIVLTNTEWTRASEIKDAIAQLLFAKP